MDNQADLQQRGARLYAELSARGLSCHDGAVDAKESAGAAARALLDARRRTGKEAADFLAAAGMTPDEVDTALAVARTEAEAAAAALNDAIDAAWVAHHAAIAEAKASGRPFRLEYPHGDVGEVHYLTAEELEEARAAAEADRPAQLLRDAEGMHGPHTIHRVDRDRIIAMYPPDNPLRRKAEEIEAAIAELAIRKA